MKEQQIKRAKRLAEILGIEYRALADCVDIISLVGDRKLPTWTNFNPEQDKALLWDLQMNHNVDLTTHDRKYCNIFGWDSNVKMVYKKIRVPNDKLPAALIDCVIEINGGYDD